MQKRGFNAIVEADDTYVFWNTKATVADGLVSPASQGIVGRKKSGRRRRFLKHQLCGEIAHLSAALKDIQIATSDRNACILHGAFVCFLAAHIPGKALASYKTNVPVPERL